jgi:hypothetical protein
VVKLLYRKLAGEEVFGTVVVKERYLNYKIQGSNCQVVAEPYGF